MIIRPYPPQGGSGFPHASYRVGGPAPKADTGGTRVRVHTYDNIMSWRAKRGHRRRKYIYGPAVDEPISMIEAGGSYAGTYYYHFDALGSVVALTSGNVDHMGETVQVYEYDVYGRVGATDASHPNRLLFTGREYDKETGLYYYRARYYNPQIGRFLQTDPVGYGAGMNLYAYCANNALNMVDPSGCTTSPDNPPAKPADEVPGWEYHEQDLVYLDQVWGWLHFWGYNAPNRLDLTLILGKWPDPTPGENAPLHHVKIGIGSIGGVKVFTLNGVGLLDENTLNGIIYESVAAVNQWTRVPTRENRQKLKGADTPFFDSPVAKWLYAGDTGLIQNIYDRKDINYILEGHAMAHLNIPKPLGIGGVVWWKVKKYRRLPTSSTLFWWNKGYDEYLWRSTWVPSDILPDEREEDE